MRTAYEVFLELPNGGRMWMTSAATLKQAKSDLEALNSANPATYLIVDRRSRSVVNAPRWQRVLSEVSEILLRETVGVINGVAQSLTQKQPAAPQISAPSD